MIWSSVPLMTAFDLVVMAVVLFSLVAFARTGLKRQLSISKIGPLLINVGLLFLGLFYFIDLLVMHALPLFIPVAEAKAYMENLHHNLQWFFVLFAATSIVVGFLKINQSQQVLIQEFEISRNALRASEDRYRGLSELSPVGVFRIDADGNCVYTNERWQKFTGLTEEQAWGEGWKEAIHPDDRENVFEEWYRSTEHNEIFSLEYRFLTPDGQITWVYGQSSPEMDADGVITGYIGTVTNITERKTAEMTIKASQDRLTGILEIAPEAVITIGEEMNIEFFNKSAEKIFGYDAEEVLGQSLEILMPEYLRDGHRKHIEGFKSSKDTYRLMDQRQEIMGLRKDGTEFPASASVSKFKIAGENIYTVMLQDITDRKQAEDALMEAMNEAQTASRAKSEFLAAMSHDLRTPLNAILGFADILSHQYFGPISDKYREYAGDIHSSGEHLLTLVNDILDLSTIEAGKQSLVKEKLSIEEIVRECERIVEEKARSNGIDLVTEVPKGLPPLYADRRASKQILLNLLSNAVKFTPEGGKITVSVKASKKNTTLKVADTGRGIPAEKLPKLTDPFTRADADPYLTEQGWGLGLTITKSLIELHEGTLDIKSKMGKGTTVTVTFPNGAP